MSDHKAVGVQVLGSFATAFLAFSATQVGAQTYVPLLAPPVISSIDSNGVNLTSGKMGLSVLDVAIGSNGSGLARIEGGHGDNFLGVISGTIGTNLTVSFGGKSEKFTMVSGQYQAANGGANSLSCTSTTCTYILADGTVASFDRSLTSFATIAANVATLTAFTKPDGEVITLGYHSQPATINGTTVTIRWVNTVTSSLGWMLKFYSQNNNPNTPAVKVEALNTSVDYCDPSPATITCTGTSQAWPYALLSSTGPTDAQGNRTNYVGGLAAPTSIVSPTGVTRTIEYDTSNRVKKVTIGESSWAYAYTQSGNLLTSTVTDADGGVQKLETDTSKNQIVSSTDPLGRKTGYVYYATTGAGAIAGAVSQVVNPDATYSGSTLTGGYASYEYDARGNVTKVTVVPKAGSGLPSMVSSATYPTAANACASNPKTCNKPLTTTDANGVTTSYTYHASSGNVASITLPTQANGVAPQTRYGYSQITPYKKNASGTLVASSPVWRLTAISACMSTSTCMGTVDERKVVISYGASNSNPTYKNVLPASQTISRGGGSLAQSTSFTYDHNGNLTIVDGPKPGTVDAVYAFYDSLNRRIGTVGIDPDGAGPRPRPVSKVVYNASGQVAEIINGTTTGTTLNSMTVVTRDVNGFDSATGLPIVSKRFIGGSPMPNSLSQRSYDALLRPSCDATRLTVAEYTNPPTSACTLGATDTDGSRDRIVKYTYDKTGALLATMSGVGTTNWHYDAVQVYNAANGTLSSVVDGKGNRTGYVYDGFNRLIKTCYPTAANGATTNMDDCDQTIYGSVVIGGATHSAARSGGRILRDGQSISFGYDAPGRMITLSGAVSESVTYDNFGQVLTHINNTTGGASASETYSYNSLGWLLSDAQPMGTVSYSYDAYGKRSQMTWPGGGLYVTYSYNDGDELTGIHENGTTQIASFDYDAYGRRVSLGRGSGYAGGYGYNTALRLSSLALPAAGTGGNSITLGYDQAGQIVSHTDSNAAYAPPSPVSDLMNVYGVNGLNRISSVGTSGGTVNPGYDARGNLTSDGAVSFAYNANNLLTSTSAGVSLTYDAQNRLQSYTAGGATTRFLYDGADLIAEYSGTGALLRRYVHGPGADEPLLWYEGSGTGTKRYLMADERGSIVGVTDASGTVLAINRYDAWGVPTTSNAGQAGRFRYTGQIWLPEPGLYHYKARMYAPTLGRFLQTDPIGYADGLNWYAYARNNPINNTDPGGMASCEAMGLQTIRPGYGYADSDYSIGVVASQCGTPDWIMNILNKTAERTQSFYDIFGGGSRGGSGGTREAGPQNDNGCKKTSWKVVTVGGGLDLSVLGGGVLDAGVALDFGNRIFGIIPDVSFYGAGGKTYGLDVSAGVSVGLWKDKSALQGSYTEIEAGFLAGSLSAEFNDKNEFVGAVATVGPGLPASAHATRGTGYLLDIAGCP